MLPEKFLIENKSEESNKSRPIINPFTNETVAEVFVPDEKQFERVSKLLAGSF